MRVQWCIVLLLWLMAVGVAQAKEQNQAPSSSTEDQARKYPSKEHERSSSPAATLKRVAVRLHQGRKGAEVQITSDRPVTPTSATLDNPDRLVLDFPDTVCAEIRNRIKVGGNGVLAVRIGVQPVEPPVTRVVVDLERPVSYEVAADGNNTIVRLEPLESKPPAQAKAETASGSADTPVQVDPTSVSTAALNRQAASEATHIEPLPSDDPAPPQAPEAAAQNTAGTHGSTTAESATSGASTVSRSKSTQIFSSDPEPSSSTADSPAAPSTKKEGDLIYPPAAQPGEFNDALARMPLDPPVLPPGDVSPSPVADVLPPPVVPDIHQPRLDPYTIGAQDALTVTVWGEPKLSGAVAVDPDGKITLPLLNQVQAAGLTPKQLEVALAEKLKRFVVTPQVTVAVRAINSRKVYLVGQVAKTGAFSLNESATVLQMLAEAGGLSDFANRKKIYVLRQENGKNIHIPFNYDQVIRGKNPAQNVLLRPGDMIVVP